MNDMTVTVCRIGSETCGFYLVSIGGRISAEDTVTLSDILGEEKLPVAVVVHTAQTGGGLVFSDAADYGLRAQYRETYLAGQGSNLFQCYATEGALAIHVENRNDDVGYREITIERLSIYS